MMFAKSEAPRTFSIPRKRRHHFHFIENPTLNKFLSHILKLETNFEENSVFLFCFAKNKIQDQTEPDIDESVVDNISLGKLFILFHSALKEIRLTFSQKTQFSTGCKVCFNFSLDSFMLFESEQCETDWPWSQIHFHWLSQVNVGNKVYFLIPCHELLVTI